MVPAVLRLIDTSVDSLKGSLRKPSRAGISSANPMADFAGLISRLSIADCVTPPGLAPSTKRAITSFLIRMPSCGSIPVGDRIVR